ncbi:MAG: F0F1 ATP synthase subunit gamma [Bacteroidales bacterium]|nr:F0F1 ATP synthase subunit gamma [Bacteroidales bacterium]
MASLREIKDHIASVRSTLKITSAMKLVASAKLRKAQQAAEGIRPYTAALSQMLAQVLAYPSATGKGPVSDPQGADCTGIARPTAPASASTQPNSSAPATGGYGCERDSSLARYARPDRASGAGVYGGGESVAIVAVASNSSLCGAFNINVIHKVQEVVEECRRAGESVEVISVGRKMAEAMRKAGFAPEDNADLVGRNSFEKSSAFAQTLIDGFNSGRYSRVLLIYNHFVSTASQKVCVETYLPFAMSGGEELPTSGQEPEEYILEPSREEILSTLLPQVMRLRVHTVLLDSIAAEHAARTLAMQAASDNAEDLLGELTLEYNKGRQQKITAEILDLVGGAQQ